jgi:putative ABC transport system substrate-binding protein
MRRRDFIRLLGGAAAVWPLAARAQQQAARPVIGFVSGRSPEDAAHLAAPFRRGLSEAGFVDGQNVTIEYHWLDGQYERLPALMADLVGRQVAVIAAAGTTPVAIAAKAATATIPIVFGVGEDPVRIGLVTSLARPGANATGINFFTGTVVAKRLGLLRDMVPRASRIAVLVNPADASLTEATLRDMPEAARTLGLQIRVLEAATSREIEAVFETLEHEPADALFVAPEAFYTSRRVQIAILAARYAIPTTFANRDSVEAGGLMSYGADVTDTYRQVGDYAGRILKGAKPADLPVIQSSKFELVINLATARALRLSVPGNLLSIADEVIE